MMTCRGNPLCLPFSKGNGYDLPATEIHPYNRPNVGVYYLFKKG